MENHLGSWLRHDYKTRLTYEKIQTKTELKKKKKLYNKTQIQNWSKNERKKKKKDFTIKLEYKTKEKASSKKERNRLHEKTHVKKRKKNQTKRRGLAMQSKGKLKKVTESQ